MGDIITIRNISNPGVAMAAKRNKSDRYRP